jgi:hypothetical protein
MLSAELHKIPKLNGSENMMLSEKNTVLGRTTYGISMRLAFEQLVLRQFMSGFL